MLAEPAVAFPLGFVEELIGRRFVGKRGVAVLVFPQIRRLASGDRGFDERMCDSGVGLSSYRTTARIA
jgi:hypothetical protein